MPKVKHLILLLVLVTSCNRPQPCDYRPSTYEKDVDIVTAQVAKKIQGETGLQLIGVGGGLIRHINRLGMSFAYYGDLSLEKSRELLVYCVEEYLAAINADEKIRPHLWHFPFTPRDIEIHIFVFQHDRRAPPLGTLCVATHIYGKVNFSISEPWPELMKEIHRETYEQAKGVVAEERATHQEGRGALRAFREITSAS